MAAFGVSEGAAWSSWCCPGKTVLAVLLASALACDGVVGEGVGLERSNRLEAYGKLPELKTALRGGWLTNG